MVEEKTNNVTGDSQIGIAMAEWVKIEALFFYHKLTILGLV